MGKRRQLNKQKLMLKNYKKLFGKGKLVLKASGAVKWNKASVKCRGKYTSSQITI